MAIGARRIGEPCGWGISTAIFASGSLAATLRRYYRRSAEPHASPRTLSAPQPWFAPARSAAAHAVRGSDPTCLPGRAALSGSRASLRNRPAAPAPPSACMCYLVASQSPHSRARALPTLASHPARAPSCTRTSLGTFRCRCSPPTGCACCGMCLQRGVRSWGPTCT